MQTANKTTFHQETPLHSLSLSRLDSSKPLSFSSQLADLSTLDHSKSFLEVRKKVKQELNFEFYFIDYDNASKKYQLVKPRAGSSSPFLKEITELILSCPRFHIKPAFSKEISGSFIQNAPKVMKPLVIPLFDGKQFAFVFQTYVCRRSTDTDFEFSDRFLIFMTEKFLPYTLAQLAKSLIKQQYEDRVIMSLTEAKPDYNNSVSLASRQGLLQSLTSYVQFSKKYYFSKERDIVQEKQQQLKWYLRNITDYTILIRLNTLHYHPILLLSLLIYYAIRQYKIILLGYKQNRHIMSEATFALKNALSPIDYCYPIIFSAISEYNDNFIDSPVPCLICYWGQESDCSKMRNRYKRINEQGLMPSVMIDLNSLTAFNSISSESESKALRAMNSYIISPKSGHAGQNAVQRANNFIFNQLLGSDREQLKEESTIFRKSLSYQSYKQDHE